MRWISPPSAPPRCSAPRPACARSAAPAALALHGRLGGRWGRPALIAAAAGELAFDKIPGVPARTHPTGLAARLTTSAVSGHRVAGPAGAALAGAAAAGSAFAGLHARSLLDRRLPVPDPVVGAAEDAIALCLVALATRDRPPEAADDAVERAAARSGRIAAGVAASAVGTAAMTAAQTATYALTAAQPSDAPGRVGRRLLEGVFGRKVRRREREALNQAMHWLYGTSWGVALGLVTARGAEPPPVARDRRRARPRGLGGEPRRAAPARRGTAGVAAVAGRDRGGRRLPPRLRTSPPRRRCSGCAAGQTEGMARSFVVQQHQATTLHYDFRLEVGGVLRSWAVPKGPSMDPAEKRLAVEVEDHSLAHGSFEGRAGKGGVIIWDRGTYEPLDDVGIEAALERGKASFRLDGEKLHGAFTLVRTRGDEKKPQWLLIKQRDDEAGENADRPESVVSGKTLEDL